LKTDVVVVGSGISGLTAALFLAKKGKRVTIVERTARPGGALKRFKRQHTSFDVGFHYTGCLGDGEILAMLWAYLGITPHLSVLPFPEHGHDALNIEGLDQVVRAYFSYEQFGDELNRIFPDQKRAIRKYFAKIKQICAEIPFYNPDLELTPFLRGYKGASQSLYDYLEELTPDRNLQAVLASPAFLYGVPVAKASVEVHAMVAHGFYSGAYGIDGGGQAIVNAYLQVLRQYDVMVLTRHKVESIQVEGGQVCGVVTDQQTEISCADVIFTGHPSAVPAMVPSGFFRPAYSNRLLELQNTCSMFAVFGTVNMESAGQEPDWVNYYHFPNGAEVLPESVEVGSRRALMMTMPGRRDSTCLKEKGNGVILLRPAYWREAIEFHKTTCGNRPADYLTWKESVAEEMIGAAEKNWGDICGKINPLAIGTPLTFRDELGGVEGCAYGAQHGISQFNPGARTRLPGFWLSGQSTLMTGVVGAALSGMTTAGEMTGLEEMWEGIRQCR